MVSPQAVCQHASPALTGIDMLLTLSNVRTVAAVMVKCVHDC